MTDKKNHTQKKPYEKPKLRRMALRADEVLALGCKTNAPGGAGMNGGLSCTTPNCFAQGS